MAFDPLYRPELWPLDPRIAHLNHGSFGAVPLPVLSVQRGWRDRMDVNPVGFFRRELQPALDDARRLMCGFLAAPEDAVAFVQNTTFGAGAVFASFPLAAEDEVLVTDHTYGAVLFGARKAAGRAGAVVRRVRIALDADDDAMVAALLGAASERTRLVVVDQVSSATAKRFPVERIGPALQASGIAVFVDGAHAPGSLPVDLGALAPDFWVGNFHKWPCAPRGSAGFYVAPRWRAVVGSFPVSWREPEGFPHSFTQVGTADQTGWLAVPAALEFFDAFGWSAVRDRNNALAAYGQQVVADAVGADLSAMPDGTALPMRLVPLVGVPADQAAADAVRDRIADEAGIEVVINVWGGRALLRVSAHLYNTETQYDRLATALRDVLAA
jgi:isopenicillin-N epimerase